ncbi:MAG: flagellar hook basal-body protein [Mariprofundaceae bacterium]|nr:flagellar hook basal-body protein [Mariprofundaceae bacterium]
MNRGFYISGVAGHMTGNKLDSISHNLANVNTVGFMRDRAAFSTVLANVGAGQESVNQAAYMTMDHQFISPDKGIIRKTGNDFDFALRGDGFFKVQMTDAQGKLSEGYTRAGNFHLDAKGTLLTEGNLPVLDTSGSKITIPPGILTSTRVGGLSVNQQDVAQIALYQIKDMEQVEKASGTVLKTDANNVKLADNSVSLEQGMLEGSNVNSVLMMVEMMQNSRSNQSMMKLLEQYTQQEGLLNDKVGRVG